MPPPGKKKRLGEILIDAGVIDEVQLKAALAEQRKWGGKLGRTLVEMQFLDEDSMVHALSRQLNLPVVDLDKLQVGPETLQLLRLEIVERYGVVPIGGDRRTKTIHIATGDPTNAEAINELAFHTGARISISVAAASAVERAIRRHYRGEHTAGPDAGDFRAEETPLAEGTFGDALMRNQLSMPEQKAVPPLAPAPSPPPSDLTQRIAQLERALATQGKALKAALELLMEKKVITRDEYTERLRGKG